MILTRFAMPPSTSPSAETARELLGRNDALTARLAELGARGAAAAAALVARGTPPSGELVQALAEAQADFAALRADTLTVAAALGVAAPAVEAVDSTRRLGAMLRDLLATAETLDAQYRTSAALIGTVAVLDRIASLTHRDDPAFSALAACQSCAADVRTHLASTGEPDPVAAAPFASLLLLIDGQQGLDDEQWAALEDSVAAAFGRALAVAATRGKLVTPGR